MTTEELKQRLFVVGAGLVGVIAIMTALAQGVVKLSDAPLWAKQVAICWAVLSLGRAMLQWACRQIDAKGWTKEGAR